MYPIQNPIYPNQSSTYPNQNTTYPIQNTTDPIQNTTYPTGLSKILCIQPHTQVGLQLYLANMFKAVRASGRELEAQLEKNCTPNLFPKVPPAKKIEWEHFAVHGAVHTACIIMHLWSK